MATVNKAASICVIALMSSLSAGCATNAIRVDRAGSMTKAGYAATDATRSLMKDVQAENRATLLDLVASDKNCKLTPPTYAPTIAFGMPTGDSELCRKGKAISGDFMITRLLKRDFAPSLATIDGLVAYFDAIDAIVTREPLDLEGGFAEAEGNLQSIAADLATVVGSDGAAIPALNDDQKAAVGGVLSLLGEIVDEANRVKDLRRIEIDLDQVAIEGSLTSLDRANERWVRALDAQLDNRLLLSERRLPKIPVSQYDARRAAANEQLTLIERKEGLLGLKNALKDTVAALRKARTDYRNLLFNYDKSLTAAERRKRAAITRSRLRAALASLASVVRAF